MVPRQPHGLINPLLPADYLDAVYGPGFHVVLLHCGDDLAREAASNLRAIDPHLGVRNVRLWACFIETPEHAETVQAVKLPQFRFFRNGNEAKSQVGVMSPEAIVKVVNEMLEEQRRRQRR